MYQISDSIFIQPYFTPFPHDKILGQTKFKAFADDRLDVTKMIISVSDRVGNIVGKGEIARTSNFSFFHNVFKRLLSKTHQKVSLCWNGLIPIPNKPWSLCVCSTSLLKTLWEKEKLLVKSPN